MELSCYDEDHNKIERKIKLLERKN